VILHKNGVNGMANITSAARNSTEVKKKKKLKLKQLLHFLLQIFKQ